MSGPRTDEARVREVRRIFEDYGLSNVELLETWDGRDVEALRGEMSEEEYQTLLDQLQEPDFRER